MRLNPQCGLRDHRLGLPRGTCDLGNRFGLAACTSSPQTCYYPQILMRRIAAHLALAAIWLGSFAPVVISSQLSTLHACCLRSGMHHCQSATNSSSDTEFRAPRSACPYSAPLPPSSFSSLETAKFLVAAPDLIGIVAARSSSSGFSHSVSRLSARAPPALLS